MKTLVEISQVTEKGKDKSPNIQAFLSAQNIVDALKLLYSKEEFKAKVIIQDLKEGMEKEKVEVLELIWDEFLRSSEKHILKFRSTHEGYAVLKEEIEELIEEVKEMQDKLENGLWESIKKDDFERARKEVIQIGAMAVKFYLSNIIK